MFLFKKINVPSGTKEITAYESWTVRWRSAHNAYFGSDFANLTHESEVFLTEEDAISFKKSLKAAMTLLKSLFGDITITKN